MTFIKANHGKCLRSRGLNTGSFIWLTTIVEYGTIVFNLCVCVCAYVCDCVRVACASVFACVWCVCACVLSSWHSLTNLSSIQIFHSDGKRPDSNSIVPWKCPFPFVDVHFYNKICHVLKGQMPGLGQIWDPVMIFTCQIPDFAPGGGGGGVSRNNDRRIRMTMTQAMNGMCLTLTTQLKCTRLYCTVRNSS